MHLRKCILKQKMLYYNKYTVYKHNIQKIRKTRNPIYVSPIFVISSKEDSPCLIPLKGYKTRKKMLLKEGRSIRMAKTTNGQPKQMSIK